MKAPIFITAFVVAALAAELIAVFSTPASKEAVYSMSLLLWLSLSPPIMAAVTAIFSYGQFTRLQERIPLEELSLSSLSDLEVIDHFIASLRFVPRICSSFLGMAQVVTLFLIAHDIPRPYNTRLAVGIKLCLLVGITLFLLHTSCSLGVRATLRAWIFANNRKPARFYILADVVKPWIYWQLFPGIFFLLAIPSGIVFLTFSIGFYLFISPMILLYFLSVEAKKAGDLVLVRRQDWWRLNGQQASWVPRGLRKWPDPYKTDWGKYKEAADLALYGEDKVQLLRSSLQLLAAHAAEQMGSLGDDSRPAELHAACQEVYRAFKHYAGDLGGKQWEAFDALVSEMNSSPLAMNLNAGAPREWFEQTICRNPHWQRIRLKARRVLEELQWPLTEVNPGETKYNEFDSKLDPLASKISN